MAPHTGSGMQPEGSDLAPTTTPKPFISSSSAATAAASLAAVASAAVVASPCSDYQTAEEGGEGEWEREAKNQPLIGPLLPLENLVGEFIPGSNAHCKIRYLCSQPPCASSQQQRQQQQTAEKQKGERGTTEREGAMVRRVRRDGCCFYRSYMFGLFEQIKAKQKEIQNVRKLVDDELIPKMLATGYKKEAIEEFVEEMHGALDRLGLPSTSLSDVEDLFNDAGVSNYLVVFARLVAAAEMKASAESYLPFLTGHASVDEFCAREVEPMWVGAEQPQILALASALGVPVEIVYIDQNEGEKPARHVFPDSPSPCIKLLYRPGHYDLLYL